MHAAEPGLGDPDGPGGFELAFSEDVDLAAGGGVAGGKFSEPAVNGVEAFEFPADGRGGFDAEDSAFLFGEEGGVVDVEVGGFEHPGLEGEVSAGVLEGASDAVAGEGGELDIAGGIIRGGGLDQGEQGGALEFFPGLGPLAFPGEGETAGQGDVADGQGLSLGGELAAGSGDRFGSHGAGVLGACSKRRRKCENRNGSKER